MNHGPRDNRAYQGLPPTEFTRARLAKGLTMEQLGRLVGCSGQKLSACTHGDRQWPPELRGRVAEVLGVSEEALNATC